MQKGNGCTVGRWCYRWFCENQSRWSDSTVGGYRNLIYRHILPEIGSIPLADSKGWFGYSNRIDQLF